MMEAVPFSFLIQRDQEKVCRFSFAEQLFAVISFQSSITKLGCETLEKGDFTKKITQIGLQFIEDFF